LDKSIPTWNNNRGYKRSLSSSVAFFFCFEYQRPLGLRFPPLPRHERRPSINSRSFPEDFLIFSSVSGGEKINGKPPNEAPGQIQKVLDYLRIRTARKLILM